MWKAIIVEDEDTVRNYFVKLIPWEQYGFHIVGEANNGVKGLELIRRLNPDLVITDIAMPWMDGIELLKTAREELRTCRFIMLTCLNEFELAQKALEYGASSYVLKLSMDLNTFGQTLQKVEAELCAFQRNKQNESREDFTHLFADFWKAYVGGADLTNLSIEADRLASKYDYAASRVTIWVGVEDVGAYNGLTISHRDKSVSTSVCFYKTEQECARLQQEMGSGITATSYEEGGIVASWLAAYRKLNKQWYEKDAGNNVGKEVEKVKVGRLLSGISIDGFWPLERDFIQAFEHRDIDKAVQHIERIFIWMEVEQFPVHRVLAVAEHIASLMSKINNAIGLLTFIDEVKTHNELKQALIEQIYRQFESWTAQYGIVTDHDVVNKAVQIIQLQYHQEISLKWVAKQLSIEEHYLSALFKRKTGTNFIKYLQKIRMERARAMLESTKLSVEEIANQVGFESYPYMIRTFKQHFNVTPGDYRKEHRGINDPS